MQLCSWCGCDTHTRTHVALAHLCREGGTSAGKRWKELSSHPSIIPPCHAHDIITFTATTHRVCRPGVVTTRVPWRCFYFEGTDAASVASVKNKCVCSGSGPHSSTWVKTQLSVSKQHSISLNILQFSIQSTSQQLGKDQELEKCHQDKENASEGVSKRLTGSVRSLWSWPVAKLQLASVCKAIVVALARCFFSANYDQSGFQSHSCSNTHFILEEWHIQALGLFGFDSGGNTSAVSPHTYINAWVDTL